MKVIFFLLIFFNLFFNYQTYSAETYVVLKVNNKIITNVDIDNEYRYLIALNPKLQNIEKKKLMNLAKNSIIREKIKEEELVKFFDLNKKNNFIDRIIIDFYKKIGLNNKKEFINYLSKYNLSFEDIEKKIIIETAWNDLVYKKYANKIVIDEKKIKNEIKKITSENREQNIYLISEILFTAEDYNDLQKKYEIIKKSILELGFNNTANIHSISDTAKLGGKIGWINESQLNDTIKKEIKNLQIEEYTKPITIPGGFLIVKLDNKKKEDIYIDFNKEVEKQISNEKNSQLKQFSQIYFKKIKKNSTINEK